MFVKNFDLPVDDTNPEILRRLETRLLVRDTNGTVYGASYKWRADNSDADLVTAGTNEDIEIKTAHRHAHAKMVLSRTAGLPDLPHAHVRRRPRRENAPAQRRFQISQRCHRQPASHARNHLGLFEPRSTTGRFPAIHGSSPSRTVPTRSNCASAPISMRIARCAIAPAARAHFLTRASTRRSKKQNFINGPVANQIGISGAKVDCSRRHEQIHFVPSRQYYRRRPDAAAGQKSRG